METQWKHRSQKFGIFKINNKILQNFLKKYFKAKKYKNTEVVNHGDRLKKGHTSLVQIAQ